jgi:hypothetical protein
MMSWGGPGFIIAIIAMSTLGWMFTSWIRAKHGYPIEGEWGGTVSKIDDGATRKIEVLTSENDKLHDMVGRLEDRISTLERIVTDPSLRLSAEIENLK